MLRENYRCDWRRLYGWTAVFCAGHRNVKAVETIAKINEGIPAHRPSAWGRQPNTLARVHYRCTYVFIRIIHGRNLGLKKWWGPILPLILSLLPLSFSNSKSAGVRTPGTPRKLRLWYQHTTLFKEFKSECRGRTVQQHRPHTLSRPTDHSL
jgi:hypothetical protein